MFLDGSADGMDKTMRQMMAMNKLATPKPR
jgi:hypothetical protein